MTLSYALLCSRFRGGGGWRAPRRRLICPLAVAEETVTRGPGAQECSRCPLLSSLDLKVCLAPTHHSCNPPPIFNPVGMRAENRPWQRPVSWARCAELGDDVTVGSVRTEGSVCLGEGDSAGDVLTATLRNCVQVAPF